MRQRHQGKEDLDLPRRQAVEIHAVYCLLFTQCQSICLKGGSKGKDPPREVGGAEGGTGTVAWGPLELEVNLLEMCITGKTRAVRCSTDTDEVTGQPVGVAKTTQVSPEDFVQDEDEAEAAAKGDKKGKKGKTKGDAAPWYAGKVPDSWAEVSGSA